MRIAPLALTAAILAGGSSAQGFVTPEAFGWSRGAPDSSYYEWDDFSSATLANVPDVGAFPGGGASATETTGLAFVTSTGNIYSFTSLLEFEVVAPAEALAGGTTTVLLQTRTQGREVDHATLLCNGFPPVEYVELYRLELGPDTIFGGNLVDGLWRFEVPETGMMRITFSATDLSMSLDRVSVDTLAQAAEPCLADVNADGLVTAADFSAWIGAFNAQAPGCDQNDDGACTPADFSAWISNFNAGC